MTASFSVLVVDDDKPMATTLVNILQFKGFEAEAAFSGPQALTRVENGKFDCVLTDIRMPEMNGVELCRAIRRVEPAIPVLFMTAYANENLLQQGLAEGVMASFEKPLDLDRLLNFVSSLSQRQG